MNRLRKYRLAVKPKMSQRKLATLIKSQQPQVSRWERWGHSDEKDPRQIPWYYAERAAPHLHCRPIDLRPDMQNLRSLDLMVAGAPEDVQDRIWGLVREELQRD